MLIATSANSFLRSESQPIKMQIHTAASSNGSDNEAKAKSMASLICIHENDKNESEGKCEYKKLSTTLQKGHGLNEETISC